MPCYNWTKAKTLAEDGRLKPWDLIEIHRENSNKNKTYRHWVMYWEDEKDTKRRGKRSQPVKVIHVYKEHGRGVKEFTTLRQVAGNDWCRINNPDEQAKDRGFKKRSKDEIKAKAEKGLGTQETCRIDYNLLNSNCENHVTDWRYKDIYETLGFSIQVEDFVPSTVFPYRPVQRPNNVDESTLVEHEWDSDIPERMRIARREHQNKPLPGKLLVFDKPKPRSVGPPKRDESHSGILERRRTSRRATPEEPASSCSIV